MKYMILIIYFFIINTSILIAQNEYICCIEYYYIDPSTKGLIFRVERRFIDDTLLLVEYTVPPDRSNYTDTFKIIDGDFYLKFRGAFYRYFSENDFDIGLPMRQYAFSYINHKATTVSYYPIEKIYTDSMTIYTFKMVEHDWTGIDMTRYYKKIYFAPEVGIIRSEPYDSKPIYMDTYYITNFWESEGCKEFLERVFK